MDFEIDNFIGIYRNAYSDDFCDRVIHQFEQLQEQGFALNRQQKDDVKKHQKDDTAFSSCQFFDVETDLKAFQPTIGNEFNRILWGACYDNYADFFSVIKDSGSHRNWTNNVQKTKRGQGYHVWHYEADAREASNRLLAYMLYLNDVEEGGETEFLYGMKRIKPEKGTLILFPASFTHTHRGNPPLSGDKYVVTGWIEF